MPVSREREGRDTRRRRFIVGAAALALVLLGRDAALLLLGAEIGRRHAPPAAGTPDGSPARGPLPLRSPALVFDADTYPPDAIRRNEQGRTVALLPVTTAGRVARCRVEASSGSAALDRTTCARGRLVCFAPALDGSGQPIAGHYTLPVRWVLPS